jgi:hypothetical protein
MPVAKKVLKIQSLIIRGGLKLQEEQHEEKN